MKAEVMRLDRDWWKEDRKPTQAKAMIVRPKVKGVPSQFFSVKEIAARLSVSIDRIYDYIRLRELDAQPIGRTWRISLEALEAFLETQRLKRRVG